MKVLNIECKMNVPNALSLVRLLLLPLFVVLFLESADQPTLLYASFGVLVVSGITDVLDGIIARRFNQITPFGKLLDPLADKITQMTVVVCLAIRYVPIIPLAVICLAKELLQGLGGLLLLRRGIKPQGARWYGKVSTAVFYASMAAILLFDDMPPVLRMALVLLVAVLMVFAFIRYAMEYLKIRRYGVEEDDTKE